MTLARRKLAQNRRLHWITIEKAKGEDGFFGEREMRARQPGTFHHLVGRFDSSTQYGSSSRSGAMSIDGKRPLREFLFDKLDCEEERATKQREREAMNRGEPWNVGITGHFL